MNYSPQPFESVCQEVFLSEILDYAQAVQADQNPHHFSLRFRFRMWLLHLRQRYHSITALQRRLLFVCLAAAGIPLLRGTHGLSGGLT